MSIHQQTAVDHAPEFAAAPGHGRQLCRLVNPFYPDPLVSRTDSGPCQPPPKRCVGVSAFLRVGIETERLPGTSAGMAAFKPAPVIFIRDKFRFVRAKGRLVQNGKLFQGQCIDIPVMLLCIVPVKRHMKHRITQQLLQFPLLKPFELPARHMFHRHAAPPIPADMRMGQQLLQKKQFSRTLQKIHRFRFSMTSLTQL